MTEPLLEIKDLHVTVKGEKILNGITLNLHAGETHAIMGPNGSGKSTLSNVILGNPAYKVTKGTIEFKGKNILTMNASERAKAGLFLSFQYPIEIPGISLGNFLWTAYKSRHPDTPYNLLTFKEYVKKQLLILDLDESFLQRELNVGFSGGEKKRIEILQLLVLAPDLAILDETDSGLDIDSLKIVSKAINHLKSEKFTSLVITHYKRILNYMNPDHIHVLVKGKIVLSGDAALSDELEEKGYAWVTEEVKTQ